MLQDPPCIRVIFATFVATKTSTTFRIKHEFGAEVQSVVKSLLHSLRPVLSS